MKNFFLTILLLCITSTNADVIVEDHKLVITGEISANDGENFLVKLFNSLQAESFSHKSLQVVELRDVSGGSILEAIKISNAIEAFSMFTQVNGYCYSACALIYLSGAKRSYENKAILGVHSISFNQQGLRELSLHEAKLAHKSNLELFVSELAKHGAPLELIEQVKHTASTEITTFPISSILLYKDYVREWAADRCGKIGTEDLQVGQQLLRELREYVSVGGEDVYNKVLEASVKSGDPMVFFEELGKKISPKFSYSKYIQTSRCYDDNLYDEFKSTYTKICSELNLNCLDIQTKFVEKLY